MPIPSFRHLDDASLLLDPETEATADALLRTIRQVFTEIGPGLAEAVYQEAMEIALVDASVPFVSKPRIKVEFRGVQLRRAAEPDFLVGERVVLELKAVQEFHPSHEAQLLSYLRVTKRPLGFLMNFHSPRLGPGIRRKVLSTE